MEVTISECIYTISAVHGGIFTVTSSVNALFARRIVGQSNFTCPFQIDQSQSLEVTISSASFFLYRKNSVFHCFTFRETIPNLFPSFSPQRRQSEPSEEDQSHHPRRRCPRPVRRQPRVQRSPRACGLPRGPHRARQLAHTDVRPDRTEDR